MNQDQFEGKWKQMKGAFREKWGKFTNDDLEQLAGNKDKIVGALQAKYGLSKEQSQKDFDEWYNSTQPQKVRTSGGKT